MALRTYYEILGVSYDAVEGEIRRGYRRAVQEHHPDQNPSSAKSQKRIRELNAARETLLNSALREKYDTKLRRAGLIPPENVAELELADSPTPHDSEELDRSESDRSVDAESVAEGFASQSFEPELESTTADWNTSAWNTNRHKHSGKKRKQRFQLLISLVMIPTGGIAGIAVAVLLLWVGFRLDPLGLFQVDGTPVASNSVDPIPSTDPLSRGSSAANIFGDPLNLNQSKPVAPKKRQVASPRGGDVLGDPLNLNQTTPARNGTDKKNTGAPTDEEMQNFLNNLDKKSKKTSSDTQGSDSPTIVLKPKKPTAPPDQSSPKVPPATNSFGVSFAKLEFSKPPQFGKLATGTAIHSDRDSVWAKVPVELDGLQATQWKVHQGRADFSVTSPGYVIMATSSRWGRGGQKDGIWDKELTTEQDLLNDGWLRYTTIEEVTKDPKYARWPVFVKQFEAGEKLQIRTEKYLAPRFFLPLTVTKRESPTKLDLTTQPKIATSAPNSDLTIIKGITERTQTALNAANIKTIDQIANLTALEISLALVKGGYYPVNRIQDYQSWIRQSKIIMGDSSPSMNTFDPISNNENNPIRESVVKLNQLTAACKQFDWIPKTETEFKTLQSLITQYIEIKKQATKVPSTETYKQVMRQLAQLETSLNQRALLFSSDDQSALKQMNRSFAESALQKPNQTLPIYGEFIQIQIASNQILVRLLGTSTYVRAPYVQTDEPMRPESKWLFFVKTAEAPKTISLKLSGGETVPTETVSEFYKFGH